MQILAVNFSLHKYPNQKLQALREMHYNKGERRSCSRLPLLYSSMILNFSLCIALIDYYWKDKMSKEECNKVFSSDKWRYEIRHIVSDK